MNIPRLMLLSDIVDEFLSDVTQTHIALESNKPRGPITGFNKIDEAFGGFLASGLHVLQAAPGAGKSALSLQIAAKCLYPALYVTAEMNILELFRRMISRQTKTYLGKLKSGEFTIAESKQLALETVTALPNLAILDGTIGYASPQQIFEIAEALKERAESNQVLVIIDSIQVWAKTVSNAETELSRISEYEILNASLSSLSKISNELKSPVLSVSHRNRQGNKSQDSSLHSAKGSGEVEYLAESVIDLTRKEDQPDANGEVEVHLRILKNRHGIPGINVPLKFCGRIQTFREII